MPIMLNWLRDTHIITCHLTGTITTDELIETMETLVTMLNNSPEAVVHILVDESDMTAFPKRLQAFTNTAAFLQHDKIGWFVLYGGTNKVANVVSSLMIQIARVRHQRFATEAEAAMYLEALVEKQLEARSES